jgi:hypothetical protein
MERGLPLRLDNGVPQKKFTSVFVPLLGGRLFVGISRRGVIGRSLARPSVPPQRESFRVLR